jgi:hypothetical protein
MSGSWRDSILERFVPEANRLILAADPDGLLFEEEVQRGIRERGYDVLPFEDPIAFRLVYESGYRTRWARGEPAFLVVVLRESASELDRLPFDLLCSGVRLSFQLSDFFPNLDARVVAALDRADLERLYQAQAQYSPGALSESATKDFILGHVFGVAPVTINDPADLLRFLLQRHYRPRRIPRLLDDHIIRVLRQKEIFREWPLETIVPDRAAFFRFLQDEWPGFLRQLESGGRSIVPFGHDLVQVFIDNLFVEGLLQPVEWDGVLPANATWARAGIKTDSYSEETRRWEALCLKVEETLPGADAPYREWLDFGPAWAQLSFLFYGKPAPPPKWRERRNALRRRLDVRFSGWLASRYQGLHNQPALSPVMVHHVPKLLARIVESDRRKVALIVVDGMAWSQWIVLRGILQTRRAGWRIQEDSVFAWIPTVTSVSRQALFAGSPPLYFPASILTTEREPSHWTRFWSGHGVPAAAVLYRRQLAEPEDLHELEEALNHPQLRVAGLVVEKLDQVMHGMKLGGAGMQNQAQLWAEQGFLLALVELLLRKGFMVAITSDHGNLEARGCGRPAEGVLAQQRGQRVRIYGDPLLRAQTRASFPDAVEWPGVGLPSQIFALLAGGDSAFVDEEETIVTHGGASFEEVVVPFVQVEES